MRSPLRSPTAVSVVAAVGGRSGDRMGQIDVRPVEPYYDEADAQRAPGAVDVSVANRCDVFLGHLTRRGPVGAERYRGRTDRFPRILIGFQPQPAFPWARRRGLATGMGDLDAEFRGTDALAMRNDARERGLAIVRIDTDAAVRDAAAPLDIGHFDKDQPGPGIRQHPEMRHMPVADDRS